MIVYSDNTATNLVLDVIGIGSTAATMEKMGYPNTKIHSKVFRRDTSVFPERSKQFGLGSTTAAEMIRLCEALWDKELVSPEACAAMLKHLRACEDKDKFPRFLPPGTKVAFKTGSLDATRTAAGIIECAQGPVALCVLTDGNADHRWVPDNAGNRLCADIARAVFDHFGPEASTGRRQAIDRRRPAPGMNRRRRASWDSSTPCAGCSPVPTPLPPRRRAIRSLSRGSPATSTAARPRRPAPTSTTGCNGRRS